MTRKFHRTKTVPWIPAYVSFLRLSQLPNLHGSIHSSNMMVSPVCTSPAVSTVAYTPAHLLCR